MTETRAGLLPSQWKVFFDGVEVPHNGFSMVMAQDQVSELILSLEPDKRLLDLRPQTMVHVFGKDRFPPPAPITGPAQVGDPSIPSLYGSDEEELKQTWFLFWEGEVAARTHVKSKGQRSMQIRARALVGILDRTRAFMLGIGGVDYSTIATGSRLPVTVAGVLEGGSGATSFDTLSMVTLISEFVSDDETGTAVSDRDRPEPTFADRLLRLISYLSNYSGPLRQQLVRTRFLNKVGAVPDAILKSLLNVSISNSLLADSQNQITAHSSVLDIVRHIMSYGFYHLVQVPFPHRPGTQPSAGARVPTLSTGLDDEQLKTHQIPYEYFRNDFMFVPEMYYALPPPCNFVFPDQIADMSIGREFEQEPTRHLIQDVHLASFGGSYVFWLAPEDVVREAVASIGEEKITSSSLFGIASAFGRSVKLTSGAVDKSPYAYPDGGDPASTAGHSLLGALSDIELEKGIVATFGQNRFEAFAALAYLKRQVPKSDISAGDQVIEDLESSDNKAYADLMSGLANYQLQLMRYRREGSVSLLGHRWVIPGLPTVIFDSDISYLANVVSTSFTVNSEGQESTTLQLDRTRPVPRVELAELQAALDTLATELHELQTLKSSVADQLAGNALGHQIGASLSKYEGLGSDVGSLYDTLQNWAAWGESKADLRSSTGKQLKATAAATSAQSAISAHQDATQPKNEFLTIYVEDLTQAVSLIQTQLSAMLADGQALATDMLSGGSIQVTSTSTTTTFTSVDQSQTFVTAAVSPEYFAYLFLDATVLADPTGQVTMARQLLGSGFTVGALKHALGSIVTGGSVSAEITGGFPANSVNGALNTLSAAVSYYVLASNALTEWLLIQKDIADSGTNLDLLKLPPSVQSNTDRIYDGEYRAAVDRANSDIVEKGRAVLEDFETRLDWPAPPVFFSPDLIKIDKLDALYQASFGCSAFYTGPYATTATSQTVAAVRAALVDLDLGTATDIDGLSTQDRLDYYFEYLSGISALNNVYQILDSERDVAEDTTPPPSWGDVAQAGGSHATPFEWEHRTFLKRSATSLGQFLTDHRLELVTQFSDLPTIYAFYHMKPASGSIRPATKNGLVFDDSLFSKLVDEKQLTTPDAASGALDADPMIELARQQATQAFLTTAARQDIILAYARAHFGTRGFDGT